MSTTRGGYDNLGPPNPVVGHVHYFGNSPARWDGQAWVTIEDEAPEYPDFSDEEDGIEYEVSLTNTFHADSPEEAVRMMIEWLSEAGSSGFRVARYADGVYDPVETWFIDGDDLPDAREVRDQTESERRAADSGVRGEF